MASTNRRALTMAGSLATAGVAHFAFPKPFDDIVPPQLPITPRQATQLSGIAELTIAGLLAVPRTRRLGGWAAAALYVAVYPANVYMAQQWSDKPTAQKLVAYGRLPLQIPLIVSAVKIARAPRKAPASE